VVPTVPNMDHLLQKVEEIAESVGLHFLQSKFPGRNRHLKPSAMLLRGGL